VIWPWSKIRALKRDAAHDRWQLKLALDENRNLVRQIRMQADQITSLKRITPRPLDEGAAGAMAADRKNQPDFVMLGLTRPDGLVRMYASRDLPQAEFGPPAPGRDFTVGAYLLTSVMANMLVVDRPTYAECQARIAEIWANWDREKALKAAKQKEIGR
jgi:hypothetical protein